MSSIYIQKNKYVYLLLKYRSFFFCNRQKPSLPTSPSQVPLYNRYRALDVEEQSMDDEDKGPSPPEVLPRPERPIPHIKTSSTRKKRRVVVVCDSLLRGAEGPIC